MNILEVENLTKKFGAFAVVDGISFGLREGEILGFLGPNGAGKTTTIQMLLALLTPTSGRISYFGKTLHDHRSEILDRVNFSSTYTNLPWDLTVKECLTFVSYLYDIKNRRARVQEIVEQFRLEPLHNHQLNSLSAGQLTRVNLAKAFLNAPSVLLLDEPTASLDPESAQYIREFLLEEQKRHRISILFTSHNMSEVEQVCNRVIFINGGKIIADDTPDRLAKSIKFCHLELFATAGIDELKKYADLQSLPWRMQNKHIIIDIKEQAIGEFLAEIHQRGIKYDEISIDKPTLEDYFLQTAKGETT